MRLDSEPGLLQPEGHDSPAGQTLIAPDIGTTSERYAANDQSNIASFVQGNYRFSKNTVAVAISFLESIDTVAARPEAGSTPSSGSPPGLSSLGLAAPAGTSGPPGP